MFSTFYEFDRQEQVKKISLGESARAYPVKLMRYWITSNLIPRKADLRVAEVGIGRGEMKYWMNSIEGFKYVVWDGYDVAKNPHIDGAGYSNIYFGDATEGSWALRSQYDCLILLHFLEHLYEPEAFAVKAASFVKSGGCIVGGMPSTPDFLIPFYERKMRSKSRDFGHVSAFSGKRLGEMAQLMGCSLEFLSGGYFARVDNSILEDQLWWLKLNAQFARHFHSVGTEIYFKFVKQ